MSKVVLNEEQKRVVGASFILGVFVGVVLLGIVWIGVKVCRAAALPTEEPGAPAVVIWKAS